jgi:PEGA domain/Tetratricopeptide repeat
MVRTRVIARAVALAVSFAVLTPTLPARADPASDVAFDAKRRGDEALVNGRPAEALALYKEAYAAKPDPALVYNMGRAHQALGDFPSALDQLEAFDKTAPPDVRAKVPGLQKLLAEIRKNISTISIAADVEGATVRIDDRVLGKTPLPGPVRVKPGPVKLYVEKEGYFEYQREITLQGGALSTFDVKLASKQTTAIVTVRSPVVGASVALDGKPEGTVPTEMILTAGAHQIELTHAGYQPARSSLVVVAGERKTLDLSLEGETPITKKWWFWTGIGVVAIGATITVIALTTERSPDSGSLAPGRINAGLKF